jgi:hypothetical protein
MFIVWLVLIVLVSVPVTLMMLLDMFNPEVAAARNRRTTAWVTVALVLVAIAGYVAGSNNDRFMTCADFAIAGSAETEGCART